METCYPMMSSWTVYLRWDRRNEPSHSIRLLIDPHWSTGFWVVGLSTTSFRFPLAEDTLAFS